MLYAIDICIRPSLVPPQPWTHNSAQGVAGFTHNDMAFMAAMSPAQFGQFAGFPAPSPAVTQLEQAQPIVAAVDQQLTEVAAPGPAEEAAPVGRARTKHQPRRQHHQPRRQPRTCR